jgi:hypothetical protein
MAYQRAIMAVRQAGQLVTNEALKRAALNGATKRISAPNIITAFAVRNVQDDFF